MQLALFACIVLQRQLPIQWHPAMKENHKVLLDAISVHCHSWHKIGLLASDPSMAIIFFTLLLFTSFRLCMWHEILGRCIIINDANCIYIPCIDHTHHMHICILSYACVHIGYVHIGYGHIYVCAPTRVHPQTCVCVRVCVCTCVCVCERCTTTL